MYYGWNIGTTMGSVPRYDNETNLPTGVPKYVALSQPTTGLTTTGTTTLVWYQGSVSGIYALDGTVVSAPPIYTEVAPGMFSMGVVDSPPVGAVEAVVMIGVVPVIAYLICIAIVAVAGAAILISKYYTSAWVQAEYYHSQEAYYDYLVETMEVISDETSDLNGDGIMDIRRIVWANGRTLALALSDYGVTALGGTSKVEEEGETANEPAPPCQWGPFCDAMTWYVLAGAVVVVAVLSFLRR